MIEFAFSVKISTKQLIKLCKVLVQLLVLVLLT